VKEVTFKGTKDGSNVGYVIVGGVTLRRNVPTVVKNSVAKDAQENDNFEFSVKDTDGKRSSNEDDESSPMDSGDFGGSQDAGSTATHDPAPPPTT
jgi:hypothetical protein